MLYRGVVWGGVCVCVRVCCCCGGGGVCVGVCFEAFSVARLFSLIKKVLWSLRAIPCSVLRVRKVVNWQWLK